MALDPQARALIDQLAAFGAPPLYESTLEEARAAYGMLAAAGGQPEQRARVTDRALAGPGGDVPVRVYRPEGTTPLPMIMFFHGGGFVVGSIETHDAPCHRLATRVPAVVVSVGYRLAPEHPFPAAVEDCVAATEWVSAHAEELGGDAGRLAVAGDSAGGNLSAVVARRARDAGGPGIAFQLLIYPTTDLTRSSASHRENGEGYLLTNELMDWFTRCYMGECGELRHSDASPLFVEDLSSLPPALVVTAELDPLRDEGEAYADRLRQAGVDARVSRYDGMIHGFYGLDAIFDASKKATDEVVVALSDALA
jgi:acetyl esterase/lipase